MSDELLHQVAVHLAGDEGDALTVLGELLLSPARLPQAEPEGPATSP
jgi:hypothetical protein